MCAIAMLTPKVAEAEPPPPAMLSPCQGTYAIARVGQAPDIEKPEPLTEAVWQQAEPLGPLFRMGRPEEPQRATTVRMLHCDGTLYIAAQCTEPQAQAIQTGRTGQEVWRDDSVEFAFTANAREPFPYVMLQVNAAGKYSLMRLLQPFSLNVRPLKHAIDPSAVRVRTGIDPAGWWICIALDLAKARISRPVFLANVMRNRTADNTDHAWMDLWTGSFHYAWRFQPMVMVDEVPPPAPRLQTPASVAVGLNRLQLINFKAGCKVLVNDQAVPVGPDGSCTVRVTQRGPLRVAIVGADGQPAVTYATEVPRPLIVQATEPFQADLGKPIGVDVMLNTAATVPVDVALEATQDAKVVSSRTIGLANGTHRVELPCTTDKPGEIQIVARAVIPAGPGESVEISARHWCAIGRDRDEFDRFRPDIDSLATVSLYRAGLADACNFYHFLQAGDGRYRHFGRSGGLGISEWSDGMVYAFALVHAADWPENPYHNDPRMLDSAIAGMEAALAPETWYLQIEHPPNRHIQAWLLAYNLLKDKVPAEQARYWRDRLTQVIAVTIERWIRPATYKFSFFSADVGTGTNHYAYHAANIYTAGKVLDRPDWLALGREMMRGLARHERDGFFPERRDIPAMHYTYLSANALGEYYRQSGDQDVRANLERCAHFCCRTTLPGANQMVIVHDGRNNEPSVWSFGDFVLSLTPEGRWLARVRAASRINAQRRPSQNNPEFWFRNAENAVYARSGPEEPIPDAFEFAFLEGRAVIVRRQGFTYGLSAICIPATTDTYRTDPQNTIELNHEKVGRILSGANSQQQPEAGSFFRKLKDRTEFLPLGGNVERADKGHAAVLEFDTFTVSLLCEVLSPTAARITVQLVEAEGDEPVICSFFPVAPGTAELPDVPELAELVLSGVRIACSQPVQLQRDFRIVDPYSLTYRVRSKPVRAYTELRPDRPFVLDVQLTGPDTQPGR